MGWGREGRSRQAHSSNSIVLAAPTHQHVDNGGDEGGNAEVEHKALQGEGWGRQGGMRGGAAHI